MSNLGAYQTITTVLKALGGPKKGLALVLGSTFTVGGVAGSFIPSTFKHVRSIIDKQSSSSPPSTQIFTIHTDRNGENSSEPNLRVGDQYCVLQRDGDAILVQVLNDTNNPYFVSGRMLATVSNFPANEQ